MYKAVLVEEDVVLRGKTAGMKAWGKCGFEIAAEFSDGLRALAYVKEAQPDIVFTDIHMPLMEGGSLLGQLRQLYPKLLVVIVSAGSQFEYVRESLRLGALDYIVKPMEEKDLEAALKKAAQKLCERKRGSAPELLKNVVVFEGALSDRLIINLGNYLEKNISENFLIGDVADYFGMNKDYLGKQIKQKAGVSFRTFYNGLKIEYAKPLLRSGQYRIYEISGLLGYSSPDYFTKLFKRIVGITPAQYSRL